MVCYFCRNQSESFFFYTDSSVRQSSIVMFHYENVRSSQKMSHILSLSDIEIMATSSDNVYNVYVPADAIPAAETKVKVADRILISPLGEYNI